MTPLHKKRNINIDLIRCCAIFTVISVHFFRNSGFYAEPLIGWRMLLMTFMRTTFMICVPLFLLITGYLMNSKELNVKYYHGIIHTLQIYIVSTILCILFERYYLHNNLSIKYAVFSIFGGDIAYSWYVEMYIGLFLLIPFLNILYHGLETQKRKQFLIITLLFCTACPSLLNIFDLFNSDFWIRPSVSSTYVTLIPDWWTMLYPITYYYIGAYIKEYDIKLSTRKTIFLLLGSLTIFSVFNIYRSYPDTFVSGAYNEWGGFENVTTSTLAFLLLLHLNLKNMPSPFSKIILKISSLSFGAYLLSYISDGIIYPYLISSVPDMSHRLKWYIVVVPLSFTCALILSEVVTLICKLLNIARNLIKTFTTGR